MVVELILQAIEGDYDNADIIVGFPMKSILENAFRSCANNGMNVLMNAVDLFFDGLIHALNQFFV